MAGSYIVGSWPSLPFPESQGATKSPSSHAGLAGMSSPSLGSGMVTSPGGMVQVSSPMGGMATSPMSVASPNNSPNQSLASGNPWKNHLQPFIIFHNLIQRLQKYLGCSTKKITSCNLLSFSFVWLKIDNFWASLTLFLNIFMPSKLLGFGIL